MLSSKTLPPNAITLSLTSLIGNINLFLNLSINPPFFPLATKHDAKISSSVKPLSFKNLYESYIKNDNYGAYSKMNNLEIIIDNLDEKELLPKVEKIVEIYIDGKKHQVIGDVYSLERFERKLLCLH